MKTILCLLVFFIAACGHRAGPPTDQERLVAVYADLLVAGVDARKGGLDSAAAVARADSVFKARGLTREQFLAALAWYNDDVVRWKPFWDSVVSVLDDRTKRGGEAHPGPAVIR